jgi:hypothetical protein
VPGMAAARGPSRASGDESPVLVQIQIAVCRQGRTLAPVEHDLVTVFRSVEQPETASAESGAVGLDDADCRGDGDGGIEGVATGIEDRKTDLGRQRMRRRNRCLSRAPRLIASSPASGIAKRGPRSQPTAPAQPDAA